ncbi:MAG: adenylyl-sulfate kinase [Bacteroidetes bacterium]|nr:adenylyl-sulfate kinase [Bacteroidota bacterium]
MGLKIGGLELFTKLLFYFIHERIWQKIRFGKLSKSAKADNVRREVAPNLFAYATNITKSDREKLNNHKAFTIWLTGLPASGKSSIAKELETQLHQREYRSYCLDGDNTRLGINSDLSFSDEDRKENIRRVAEICKLFNDSGIIIIASFISPFELDRLNAKKIIGSENFIEVFVDANVETCKQRDKKGLYKLAAQGKLKNFTGVNSPYERPASPDIHLRSDSMNIEMCVNQIINTLSERKLLVYTKAMQLS